MLTTSKNILTKATKGKYGVGAFNFVNMEILQAVIKAANEEKSPIILQASEGAIKYMSDAYIIGFIEAIKKDCKVPVAVHLDHGLSFDMVKRVISLGFTSVMIDASKYDFEENVRLTQKVVKYAHARGVSVEAELGTIGGTEDNVTAKEIIYTEPEKAKEFVKRTGCDCLAVAIGTSHGAHKFKGKANLAYDILKEIRKIVKVPLVMHGASAIPADAVNRINRNGGKVEKACGVDDISMKKAVRLGISKVNTDTDLRMIWTGSVREVLKKDKGQFDLRKILGPARDNLVEYVKKRMKVMGSSKKA